MPTGLTDFGAHAAQQGPQERKALGRKLLLGQEDVTKYTTGVCYDAAAFVRFLLGSRVTKNNLLNLMGQNWVPILFDDVNKMKAWDGATDIPQGTAIGFWRQRDSQFFHAAIAIGNFKLRGVNSIFLGPAWSEPIDYKKVLGAQTDGTFMYDGTPIKAYLSTA